MGCLKLMTCGMKRRWNLKPYGNTGKQIHINKKFSASKLSNRWVLRCNQWEYVDVTWNLHWMNLTTKIKTHTSMQNKNSTGAMPCEIFRVNVYSKLSYTFPYSFWCGALVIQVMPRTCMFWLESELWYMNNDRQEKLIIHKNVKQICLTSWD